jgi:TolB-like protein
VVAAAAVVLLALLSVPATRARLFPPKLGNSIAVLPLQSLSDDPEQRHFADAMTDLLLTDLGRIPQLRVVSRQSVLQYAGSHKDLPQIARELKVDTIVEGTVRREGRRVRITAQLIHAPTDRHLWAQSYERDLGDALDMQQEVAESIAREIGVQLAPASQKREARHVSPAAREAFLRGLSFLDAGDDGKATQEFRAAIAIDPNYGPAYTKIAGAYFGGGFFGFVPPKEAFPAMKEAALKAIELDDTDAEAHATLASEKLHYEWDWAGAEREFRRSLELNPSDADVRHIYAHYLLTVGRAQESLAQMDRAFETDPVGLDTAT